MAKNKKQLKQTEKSYKSEIAAAEKSIKDEKKTYRKSVKTLLKADDQLRPIAKKAAKKPTTKNLEKLDAAKKSVAMAALEYKTVDDNIDAAVTDLQQMSDYLSRFYFSVDKPKAANKEKARFDKYYQKHNEELNKVAKNSDEVVSAAFAETDLSRQKNKPMPEPQPVPAAHKATEVSEAPKADEVTPVEECKAPVAPKAAPEAPKAQHAPVNPYAPYMVSMPQYVPFPQYIPFPQYMPVPPQAEQPKEEAKKEEVTEIDVAERELNIAPIDLDVSDIVAEAVNATMQSFMSVIEQKIAEYAETISIPTPPSAESATVVVAAPGQDVEGRTEALQTVAEEQAFVVSKLSELVDGMKEIMDAIDALSAKSVELLDKQKAASEVQNDLTKTQRTTMREIQGIQVRQKLVITEQEALVAEQTVAFEHHKLVAEAQQALSEQQQISVDEINALVEGQMALNASVKETVDSNKSLVALAEKTAEAQKALNEKQQDLVALQKEVMAAHRQIARGQRSSEAKRRSAENRAAKKAAAEETKVDEVKAEEVPVAEAPVVEPVVTETEPTNETNE